MHPANPLPPESSTVTSTFSHLHQYFPCLKYLAVTYINTKNSYEKQKCRMLCFLEELFINQDYYQDVKNINRLDIRINRIQTIGRHFT